MKQLLITIAAVVLVGCGESQQSAPAPEVKREPPTAEVLDIDINYAAALGNIEAVKQAIADGADLNAKGDGESTPLHFAALQGHNEIADLLIAEGADVNAKDDRGETALHRAAWRGYKEKIVELLIANSADVNAKNNDGITPLDWANSTTADLLRKHGGKTGEELEAEESIHAAARLGNIEAVKQQLAAGKDVDARDNQFGETALHFAAEWGHKEIAEMLIAGSADVNAKDNDGETPLDFADKPEIADLLRKHGAKTGEELKASGN